MREIIQARWLLRDPFHVQRGGALVLEEGRIGELHSGAKAGLKVGVDLGDAVLLPGFVNAHAHLELPALGEEAPREFLPWVSAVLGRRAKLRIEDYESQVRSGAKRLLSTGTTCVGDVDSSGASTRLLPGLGLRSRVYREVLDGDNPERFPAQQERLALPWPEGLHRGLSPHAPHTVSDALLKACVQTATAGDLPLSVHWSETPEELSWLLEGSGPLANFLKESPRCSGLDRLQRGGALTRPLSLVHGNFAAPGELAHLVQHQVSLVHCPGTHRYFGRDPVPMMEWVRCGLQVALGTDSLASNGDLDMAREMLLLREQHPELAPAMVLDWATRGGARALSLQDSIGDLSVGKWADFIALDASGMESPEDVVDGVTAGRLRVLGVWVAGRRVPADDCS